MKYLAQALPLQALRVAPVRERGLKSEQDISKIVNYARRSREGAWIEILLRALRSISSKVAPVRERGLKLLVCLLGHICELSLP